MTRSYFFLILAFLVAMAVGLHGAAFRVLTDGCKVGTRGQGVTRPLRLVRSAWPVCMLCLGHRRLPRPVVGRRERLRYAPLRLPPTLAAHSQTLLVRGPKQSKPVPSPRGLRPDAFGPSVERH